MISSVLPSTSNCLLPRLLTFLPRRSLLPVAVLLCSSPCFTIPIYTTRLLMQNLMRAETRGQGIEMETFYKNGFLHDHFNTDIEQKSGGDDAHLLNNTVRNFIWQEVTVTVKDNKTGKPKAILDNVEGIVKAGNSFSLSNFKVY